MEVLAGATHGPFPNGRHDDQVNGSSVPFNAIAFEPQNIVIRRKLTGF